MAIIDTLKLAHPLRDHGGFSQAAAEATAEALSSSFTEEVATKRDIDDLRAATKLEIAELRAEMARLHNEIVKWMFGQTFVILAVVAAPHFVK
jgi:hypothetical protein